MTEQLDPKRRPGKLSAKAFSVLELLAVLATIMLLACIAMPALSHTRVPTRSLVCVNNMHNLITAWQAYAVDNQDRLLTISHGASNQGGVGDPFWGVSWASGFLDWTTGTDNTNTTLLNREPFAKLAKYLNGSDSVFRCPADVYLSAAQRSFGWTHRSRSYSQNVGVGDGNAESGPWNPIYRHIRKASEFQYPGPRDTWVFIEEHPDSINDGAFFSPSSSQWVDIPAPFHNGSTPLAFADGHAEIHPWQQSLTRGAATVVSLSSFPTVTMPPNDEDYRWLAYHTSRILTNGF